MDSCGVRIRTGTAWHLPYLEQQEHANGMEFRNRLHDRRGPSSHLAYTSVLLRKVEGWTMLNLSLLVLTTPFHAGAPQALTAFPFGTRVVVSLQHPW